jgi:hypothetical protein
MNFLEHPRLPCRVMGVEAYTEPTYLAYSPTSGEEVFWEVQIQNPALSSALGEALRSFSKGRHAAWVGPLLVVMVDKDAAGRLRAEVS